MLTYSLLILTLQVTADPTAEDIALFEQRVRPVIVQQCQECHGAKKQEAGLRLDSRDGLLRGGDSGPAFTPDAPNDSRLLQAVRHIGDLKMPPDKKLSDAEIVALAQWLKAGAPWPGDAPVPRPRDGQVTDEDRRFWSFQPVKKPALPTVQNRAWPRSPVDNFILEKLAEKKLSPSAPADQRTFLRRATFDLLGIPPSPSDVELFLSDTDPDAVARLTDRLLASPHYGERWGRHWLDVVRYADTAGETADFPAPHAWRYRNYVIQAYNADKPYGDFIREQLAGDILANKPSPGTTHTPERFAELVTATGYIGIARRFGFDVTADHYLTLEDTIDTLGKSFLGLTIACARCHHHKYDPISTADYYGLYGIFASTRFPFPGCEKVKQPRDLVPLVSTAEWERTVVPFRQELAAKDEAIRKLNEQQTTHRTALQTAAGRSSRMIARGQINEGGEQAFTAGERGAGELAPDGSLATIAVRRGEVLQLSVSPKTNHGGDSTLVEWLIEEVGGQTRHWRVNDDAMSDLLAGNPHADRYGQLHVWSFLDLRGGWRHMPTAVRNQSQKPGLDLWHHGDTPSAWVNNTDQPITVWTTLPPRSFFVHPAADGPVGVAWQSPFDGIVRVTGRVADAHPNNGDGIAWQLDHLAADLSTNIASMAESAAQIQTLTRERTALAAREPQVPVAYGVMESQPQNARIHLRGDPEKLGEETPRRFLQLLNGEPVATDAGSGRLALAEKIADPANPLTSRVLVNRIWQQHFGRGLVTTPNDFGTRGQPPTHPELLDWLAATFVQGGSSMKSLHREILLSATYQQAALLASSGGDDLATLDPDNQWLGRFSRRRLSAEEIRDTLLAVSDSLDRIPGGPHPFPAENSWGFTQHGPFSAVYDSQKRSVYLMVQRIKRHPFLALFDGADPNTSTPDRFTTTVPTQALFFMNDPFVFSSTTRLSEHLATLPNDQARIERAYQLCFQRSPTSSETVAASQFISQYIQELPGQPLTTQTQTAWTAWCRVLTSSSELIYVD